MPGHALRRDGRRSTRTRSRSEALRVAREERRPILVEAITYRFRGHSMADPEEYRTKEQVEEWRERDPILTFGDRLVAEGVLDEDEREELDARRGGARGRGGRVRRRLALPAARVALRRRLRARRPGPGLVLGRRALARRAPRRGRARRDVRTEEVHARASGEGFEVGETRPDQWRGRRPGGR